MVGEEYGRYRPIGDYALIGDDRTTALVSSHGSIDWCCWPQIDSPAVFCRLLDAEKGGSFRLGPAGDFQVSRHYVGGTNILATTFLTASGRFRVTDLMPVSKDIANRTSRGTRGRLLRLVEGLAGEVDVDVEFRPTFDYARSVTSLLPCHGGAIARAGGKSLLLSCPAPLEPNPSGGLSARLRVAAGDRTWISLDYQEDGSSERPSARQEELEGELARTLQYWQAQWDASSYQGPYRTQVLRSALVLKLLTFDPTGAIVAAPTTSLPEEVGGVRNWDYRYCWLRDSSLILYALQSIGYHNEAAAFFEWVEGLHLAHRDSVQIMYTVHGGDRMPEQTLDHLEGYRGSRPVRIGNAAAGQRQLDIYGEVLDAAHLYLDAMHKRGTPELWDELRLLANRAALRWQEPDQGIWEVRGGPQHFLYSKLLCWVALDRALRIAEKYRLPGDISEWRSARKAVRETILRSGYHAGLEAFTQALGSDVLDASALMIPLVGFLPPGDPRVRSTVARIQERLTSDGLVYRYLAEDGLPGGEGTFSLCSFWMVDNLALSGRADEARRLFERLIGYSNDVGLMAEEIVPETGEQLGNYPQGFTHLGLIQSALNIAKAEESGPEEVPETAAERQPRAEQAGRVHRD